MKDNKIDRLFKERLENQKSKPPAHLWEKIEESIPHKSKKSAFLPWVAAASILLILGFGYIGITQVNWKSDAKQLAENQLSTPANSGEKTVPQTKQETKVQTVQKEAMDQLPLAKAQRKASKTHLIVAIEPETKPVEQVKKLELLQPKSYSPMLEMVSVKSAGLKGLKGIAEYSPLRIPSHLIFNTQNYAMTQADFNQKQRNNNKFGFVRSVANIAKSVDRGAEAISDLREAKNEWVNETLITEGESEDSPNNKLLK